MADDSNTSTPRTSGDPVADASEILYKTAQANSKDEKGAHSIVFHQEDLLANAPEGITTGADLMPLIQRLVGQGLFRTLRVGGKLGWSVRPREAARQLSQLDRDEKIIYEMIEESHTKGLWTKDIKRRTGLAQSVVANALKKMGNRNLVKPVVSVQSKHHKTYMLAQLTPSEDVTGNSFYDAGDLDESFRDELLNLIVFWVKTNSWVEGKRPKHRRKSDAVEGDGEGGGKKRKRPAGDIEDVGGKAKQRSLKYDPETDFAQLIYRAGTHNYPTAKDIHTFVTTTEAIRPIKANSLTVEEIQNCIDVLVWDEKLERMPNANGLDWGYRTVRGVSYRPPGQLYDEYEEHPGTGLTQAPCGRCPVFDLCHEGGPVNAAECVYYTEWLKAS